MVALSKSDWIRKALEVPGEPGFDYMIGIGILNLQHFVADYEVGGIADGEFETGVGSPSKLGVGVRVAVAGTRRLESKFIIGEGYAAFGSDVEQGRIGKGDIDVVSEQNRDGGQAGFQGVNAGEVFGRDVFRTSKHTRRQRNFMNDLVAFDVVLKADETTCDVGKFVIGSPTISAFNGHAEGGIVLLGVLTAGNSGSGVGVLGDGNGSLCRNESQCEGKGGVTEE